MFKSSVFEMQSNANGDVGLSVLPHSLLNLHRLGLPHFVATGRSDISLPEEDAACQQFYFLHPPLNHPLQEESAFYIFYATAAAFQNGFFPTHKKHLRQLLNIL